MARRRIGVADVKEILVAWDAGQSVSGIARLLGYTRPTVRKYVHAAERVGLTRGGGRRQEEEWSALTYAAVGRVGGPTRPATAQAEVAHYRPYLEQWVGSVPLSVLHQRLRDEQGLRASWRTFHRYATGQWPDRLCRRPQATIRRDDPPPGEEAQVDFFYVGLWDDPQSGRRRKLYAFLMTLSHSRHQFLYPVPAEDMTAWLEGHVAAFTFFGGVPRRVIPDNLTAGILTADRYDPRVNRTYGELARHYQFLVDPARARHPKDKPRVERGVSYARESCFRGRVEGTLAQLRSAAVQWCGEVAGQRVHGTTGERPLEAFHQREQAALRALPAAPWEWTTWTSATVHPDCHLRAGGVWYSAPARYVGHRLDVRVGERTVTLYAGADVVTTHVRQEKGRVTRLEHYPEAGQAFLRGSPAACLRLAQEVGEATGQLVAALLDQSTLTRQREAQALLRLATQYPPVRLEQACQRALSAGDGRYRTVRGILERRSDGGDNSDLAAPPVSAAGAFLRGPEAFSPAPEEVPVWSH